MDGERSQAKTMTAYRISVKGVDIGTMDAADESKVLYALLHHDAPTSTAYGIVNKESLNGVAFDKYILPLRGKKDDIFERLTVEKLA